MAEFALPETLNPSTPKISKYLATIRPAVEKLSNALKSAFKGASAVQVLDQVKDALDAADTTQELARKNAPDQTQVLYELMGRVLEHIEDMNRAGRSAFDGHAQTAGKFNKDVLLRGRKGTKAAATAGGGAEDGAAGGGGATG